MPWETWYSGRGGKPGTVSPFKWSHHFGFGVGKFNKTYVSQWRFVEINRKVGVLCSNDADGNAIRANLAPLLTREGFTIVDPGPYEDGTTDYAAQIAIFKSFSIPHDSAAFRRQAAQQGFARQVTICQAAKTGPFPDGVQALGRLGYSIASAAYWHHAVPYSFFLTGVTGAGLASGYEHQSGKQWTQQLGASISLLDAGITVLWASGSPASKDAVVQALGRLATTTMIGKVDFTSRPTP